MPRNRHYLYMEHARRAAEKSCMTHKHGCVAVLDGVGVIATGHNRVMEHLCHGFSIHAEMDAIHRARKVLKKQQLQCVDLYVVRISNTHSRSLKLSKPCQQCQKLIADTGIRRAFYSE